MSYDSIIGHRSMAMDEVRNAAYLEALRGVVTRDSVVLDLGAGLGTLGLLAARLGARRVYLVEPSDVATFARGLVLHHGLEDRVEVLHERIEEVDLPERADVVTSVMTGNFLLEEDLLPVLFHARDHHLAAGGVLLPSEARMHVQPVACPGTYAEHVEAWRTPHLGLDFSAGAEVAANTIRFLAAKEVERTPLAAPAELWRLDLATARSAHLDAAVELTAETSGTCHALQGWFRIRLGAAWLSTGPEDPATHWRPAWLPITPPLAVEAGDRLRVRIVRPVKGDWTWGVETPRERRRHSSFFAHPLTASRIRHLAPVATPRISRQGAATRVVLARMDGQRTNAATAAELRELFPRRFRTDEEALDFVQEVVRRYGEPRG